MYFWHRFYFGNFGPIIMVNVNKSNSGFLLEFLKFTDSWEYKEFRL